MYIYICMYLCKYICISVSMCMCVSMVVDLNLHAYAYRYVDTRVYIYTDARINACFIYTGLCRCTYSNKCHAYL